MEISGIMRAINAVGSQTELARRLSAISDRPIHQSSISRWAENGYAPRKKARLVSQVTDIPITDLLRQTPRKGSKHG